MLRLSGEGMHTLVLNTRSQEAQDCLDFSNAPTDIIIPGYFAFPKVVADIGNASKEQGRNVLFAPSLPVYSSLDDYVLPLQEKIDSLLGNKIQNGIRFIGHSMGGRVAMAAAPKYNGNVTSIHTCATPYRSISLFGLPLSLPFLGNPFLSSHVLTQTSSQIQALVEDVFHVPLVCHVASQDAVILPENQKPQSHPQVSFVYHDTEHVTLVTKAYAQRISQTL